MAFPVADSYVATTGRVIRAGRLGGASLSTTFTLTSATTGADLPFAFGHVFRKGDVPAGMTARTSDATDWQCSPMTYWSDGSLRHAIVAGRSTWGVTGDKVLALTAGAAIAGTALAEADLAAALPPVDIAAGSFTWTLNASVGTGDLHRVVCAGPVMANFIYRKPVTGNSHLVLWADVRVYKGGAVEVFPWIENAYLLVAGPTNDVRTYTVTIAGVERFSASIDVKHHTRIPLLSGSSFSYWTGTNPQITPKHNTSYLRATKMVPNYAYTSPSATVLDALQQTYTPNTLASINASMGVAGTSAAILNREDALCAATADARAWRAAYVFGLSGGSWSTHYRSEVTNEPFSFNTYPNVSINLQNTPVVPTGSGTTNGSAVTSHQPNYGYLMWLLSGRWWFLDEMQFWGGWNYLRQVDSIRLGASGVFRTNVGANTDRGAAWTMRTLAQCLATIPSSHPRYSELKASWEANMAWYAGANTGTNGGIGVNVLGVHGFYGSFAASVYTNPSNSDVHEYGAGWMQNMVHGVIGFAWDLDLPQSPTSKTNHEGVRDFGYTMPVMLAGDGLGNNWSYRNFTVFWLNWGTVGGTYYPSWDGAYAIYKAGNGIASLPAGTTLFQHSSTNDLAPNTSSEPYFGQALTALAYAVDHGMPGAVEGWQRVTGASNFESVATGIFNNKPEYGLAPRVAVPPAFKPLPSWLSSATPGNWVAVPASTPSTSSGLVPALIETQLGGVSNLINDWSGGAVYGTTFFANGGGHGDYAGNEIGAIDLGVDAPAWRKAIERTPYAQVAAYGGQNYYGDGHPTARHTYYGLWTAVIGGQAKFIRVPYWMAGASYHSTYYPGPADVRTPNVEIFDIELGQWDAPMGPLSTPAVGSETPVCQDSSTGDLYTYTDSGKIYRWRPSDNSSALLANIGGNSGGGGACAFDVLNQRLVRFAGRAAHTCSYWNIATNTRVTPTLAGPDAAQISSLTGENPGWGIAHDTSRNVVYLVTPTNVLYRVRLDDFYVERLTPGGATPGLPVNQVWGRLKYVAALDAIVYVPRWDSAVHVMRCF